jgi:hypothetical protein
MADKSVRYAPEFKRQMVDLVYAADAVQRRWRRSLDRRPGRFPCGSGKPSAMPGKVMAD